MHDYIHAIHPEDEIQAAEGEYLMYRSYPEFTAKRLAMAKSAPRMLIDSWTDAQRRAPSANDLLTNRRYLLDEKSDKGAHEMVMFWFLSSNSEQHGPLSDTIERRVTHLCWPFPVPNANRHSPSPHRLMTFIRKGEPYPYNLDRPPSRAQYHPSSDVTFPEGSATLPVDVSSGTLRISNKATETKPYRLSPTEQYQNWTSCSPNSCPPLLRRPTLTAE
jgi:hypothetical protein